VSFALLFAGQGTQHVAMLPWLEAEVAGRTALEAMQRYTGLAWRESLLDPDARSSNAFAQPLITGTSLAAWAAIRQHLLLQVGQSGDAGYNTDDAAMPAIVAGYSVGELAAFACAQVLDVESAVALAAERAALMDAAVAGLDTGLLSVAGIEVSAVLALDARLDCAIHIAADHGIYAGEATVVEACSLVLSAGGATCKRLDVRVASHSRWMAQAAEQLAQVLPSYRWAQAQCPIVLDATGTATRQTQALQKGLATQLCSTVQWAACTDAIAEKGVRCVMEVGAGTALANMWNARHAAIPARSVDDFRDAAGAARWIARHLEA
jgi:[acyl-carrier-protein] S-malonyltransferase